MGNWYIFIDESWEKHHSSKSSKYFMLHGLVVNNLDYQVIWDLIKLRLDIHSNEKDKPNKFHASEDMQIVRDNVFDIIKKLDDKKDNFAFSVILEKSKWFNWKNAFDKHHQNACKWLLWWALHDLTWRDEDNELIICFDSMPWSDNKSKSMMIKWMKLAIADYLEKKNFKWKFTVFHQESAQNPYLQIIDYIWWAIYRKYEKEDDRSYDIISKYIINIFKPFTKEKIYPRNLLSKKTLPEEVSF